MILTHPSLPYVPKRIISLVPSQTELLYDLGLQEEVIGITKFCVHPQEWFRTKARVGGTKSIHLEKIKTLQPDLVIANKEENVKEQVEAASRIAPVWVSDIHHLEDALQMTKDIGALTHKMTEADKIATRIETGFRQLKPLDAARRKALYLIWHNPWMSVGKDTFIHDMLERTGWENAFQHCDRYPALTDEDIKNSNASLVLLSSEPYPFKEKHIAIIKALLPEADIKLADGEMFSWYGSRLLHAPAYFRALFGENI